MTAHDALASSDRTERLFPAGHPLERLVAPTFDTIRRSLRGMFVSTIWLDGDVDPTREGFRPSYDSVHGPGSAMMMPFVASWLSTGPGSGDAGNVVVFAEGMDPSLVEWAKRVGILGPHEWVPSVPALRERVRRAGGRLYNIDDLGEDFDAFSMVGSKLSLWLNAKDDLANITRFAPQEVVKDMYDAGPADFEATKRPGARVFLKTCNTENAGMGVYIADTLADYEAHLAGIREKQARFGLSRRLVVQQEIKGENKSFQVLLDPRSPDEIQVVAVTDQLVEADGKTYRSSVNHPIVRETVEPVGEAILDMVDRIRARHPEAFGFLMSDYFQTASGPVIYDPGIRPTGNTATALAAHLARKITGRPFVTSLVPLPTKKAGLTWAGFCERYPALTDPDNLVRERRALVPWGWNPIQGFGMVIALAEDMASVEALRAEISGQRFA